MAMKSAYEYEIRFPDGYDPDRAYPTIFTLHGRGSNERNMAGLTEPLSEAFLTISSGAI
jgi:phospholipase/carboxylesterase